MAEEKKYESYWAKNNVYDVPTLMQTAINMESKIPGGGFFTKKIRSAMGSYDEKLRMEYAQQIEADPNKKRYYMPAARQVLTDEQIKNLGVERDKEIEKVTKQKENYMKQWTKPTLDENGKPIEGAWTINEDAFNVSGLAGKGKPTANKLLELKQEISSKIESYDDKIRGIKKNYDKKEFQGTEQANKNEKIAMQRLNELDENANKYVKKVRKQKELETSMWAQPLSALGKSVSNIGYYISEGRSYRRG